MSKKAYDQKLEALQALRTAGASPSTIAELRKTLRDRNNFLVSKAAAIAADLSLPDLIPDMLAAFDRFMIDPVKTDPQCWAKNAIIKALKNLGHRGAQVYLRGITHVQMEPVWGGSADTAATLRGSCALALAATQLDDIEILGYLGDALADPEKPVRMDAASAIVQIGRPEGALLLRLKALLGDPEPDVVGQCFIALVSLVPRDAVAFLARFLKSGDDEIRLEAAAALAQSHETEAIQTIEAFWRERLSPQLRRAVVLSLAASPLPTAAEMLLSILAKESSDLAQSAIEALGQSRFRSEFSARAAAIVHDKDDSGMTLAFDRVFAIKATR